MISNRDDHYEITVMTLKDLLDKLRAAADSGNAKAAWMLRLLGNATH